MSSSLLICRAASQITSRSRCDGPRVAVTMLAGCTSASATPAAKQTEKASDIITAKMEAMNSENGQKPPTKFNKGSVSPLKPPKSTKTKTGFEVKFASGATITTPTVYA